MWTGVLTGPRWLAVPIWWPADACDDLLSRNGLHLVSSAVAHY